MAKKSDFRTFVTLTLNLGQGHTAVH